MIKIFPWALAESLIQFYFPLKGSVLDLFAGGSVRGIAFSLLGCVYHGCEVSTLHTNVGLLLLQNKRGTSGS